MNKYFQKIKDVVKKYMNSRKVADIKKKILENSMDSSNTISLSESQIDAEIMKFVLQDSSVIDKLYESKTLLLYVSILKEDDQLAFLNDHIDMFKENTTDVYVMALENISFNKILKTQLGAGVVDAFPRECYQKIQGIDEDELEEINKKMNSNFSSYSIANKIFEIEKGTSDTEKRRDFIKENIGVKDKISVLKTKTTPPLEIVDIIGLQISDKDKIELISSLNSSTRISYWIFYDKLNGISDELKKYIIDRTSERDYREFSDNIIKKEQLSYPRFQQITHSISVLGKENLEEYLADDQKQVCDLVYELGDNFEKEEIIAFLTRSSKSQFLEMNFLEKHPIINNEGFTINNLIDINDRDKGLFQFKKYCDFRKDSNELDFCEGLYQSLYEYNKYGKLYNDILNSSDREMFDFKDKWNDLMSLDNKFGIQSVDDFNRIDEIEKDYYSKILQESNSISDIKQAISEILVRDGNISKITKLGNGIEYSMENKPLEDIVDLLSTINEITDEESLKGILNDCIRMIGTEDLKRIREIGSNIEEKIAHEYRAGYTNSFTNYDDMSDDELSKIEGIGVQRINGVRVIELKGAKFSFLSHTGDIQGKHVRCCCTQITDENFSTFGNGLDYKTYIYSKFSPSRIKFINLSDAGNSDYKNTYVSSNDLPSSTQEAYRAKYNEVTLATRKENGDDGLKPTAVMTNKGVGTNEFNKLLNSLSNNDSKLQTIYILHEDIYDKKNEQESQKKQEDLENYLKTLDPKLLNLILRHTGGKKENMDLVMEEIKKNISIHMDEKVEKSTLRRNITRYWQLSRGKDGTTYQLPYDIMNELKKELEQRDNELLVESNIKDKAKEVSDGYEFEQ